MKICQLTVTLFSVISIANCGMQLIVPAWDVIDSPYNLKQLEESGFITVGVEKISFMQRVRALYCSRKTQVCGANAAVSAASLLTPKELSSVQWPTHGQGTIESYEKFFEAYPIMRPKAFPKKDVGVLQSTLASFLNKQMNHHRATNIGSYKFSKIEPIIKNEIRAGRPVLINVRITDLPLVMPDKDLGLRTFSNSHWIVLIGFNDVDKQWLIRDNGDLYSSTTARVDTRLIRMSFSSLTRLANNAEFADDVKLYLDDPDLPVFLDDWNDGDEALQLKKDFREMKAFNIIIFEPRRNAP